MEVSGRSRGSRCSPPVRHCKEPGLLTQKGEPVRTPSSRVPQPDCQFAGPPWLGSGKETEVEGNVREQ